MFNVRLVIYKLQYIDIFVFTTSNSFIQLIARNHLGQINIYITNYLYLVVHFLALQNSTIPRYLRHNNIPTVTVYHCPFFDSIFLGCIRANLLFVLLFNLYF